MIYCVSADSFTLDITINKKKTNNKFENIFS